MARNLVDRNFTPEGPNRLWVTDITYIHTDEGWLYLAAVLDCYSRRVVGWSMASHLRTELCLNALNMAWMRRRPGRGLMHHSDRGCPYTSQAYQQQLAAHGIIPSMSHSGEPYDNAVMESFFATLKSELAPCTWPTRHAAENAIFEWVEVFYNRQRLHSTLAYRTPSQFEESPGAVDVA